MSGFQRQVNSQPAPAVEGDFASANPRASVLAGPGGLVAGALGVTVGRFAWVAPDGVTVTNYGEQNRAPAGFVHREQQALITAYLGESSNLVPGGFMITLMNEGDFWAVNNGPSAMAINDSVYAAYSDGKAYTAAPASATGTGAIGSTNTAALGSTSTGTASGDSLTLSSLTGFVSIGDTVSGTGVPAGTTITSQVSGTAGLAGVYKTSVATTASAATITTYGNVIVVSATTGLISIGDTVAGGAGFPTGATIVTQVSGTTGGAGTYTMSARGTAYVASATGVTTYGTVMSINSGVTGTFDLGEAVTGTGVPSGAVISAYITGTGGTGTYRLSVAASAYAASTTITSAGGIVTLFKAQSAAAVGELVKISTWGK